MGQVKDTFHVGAFEGMAAVACASLMRRPLDGVPAWQLRGMATRADRQGQGIGRRLLAFIETQATGRTPAGPLWCNARIAAAPFYERGGWAIVSEAFDITGVGPHVRMTKKLFQKPRTRRIGF